MDRDTQAQDNAEHLYRWIARNRPEVNAFFVLNPTSPDWDRLARDGFRLLDPAGEDFVLAVKNAQNRISSQIDHYFVKPLEGRGVGEARGRLTFLQHGVTKDDVSRWLSHKPISLLVTTTREEHESIVGDHTPYLFTSKEVRLLGMPRHDRLLGLVGSDSPRPHRLLLAPTWRRELMGEALTGNDREVLPGFWDSSYMRGWQSVMESPMIREQAARHGLTLSVLPHPNLDRHLAEGLPSHVELLRYADHDVQEVLASAALMVTDFSSLAWEQALLERPVVYYRPDGVEIWNGKHIGRRGTWSYEKDGFGPVAETVENLVAAIEQHATETGVFRPPEVYRQRMETAFPFRDGLNCERVFDAIRDLDRPSPESLKPWRSRVPAPPPLPDVVHVPLAPVDER